MWYQKSREKWIIQADRNTSFYHASVVIKGAKKRVHALHTSTGDWCNDQNELVSMTFSLFKKFIYSRYCLCVSTCARSWFPSNG